MKIKNKGKVHPSPSSSSSSASSVIISGSSSPNRDALSVLSLLPAAILALASVLSLQDREVLAYMITRSMKTTTTTTTTTTSNSSSSSSSVVHDSKKKLKKPSQSSSNSNCNNSANHKPPLFDCDCFGCYTCYWFRWDSSPNRELIHQVIEAFEDHLAHGEKSKKINGKGGKRKEKSSRRIADKPVDKSDSPPSKLEIEILNTALPETDVISSEMEPLPEKIDPVEVSRDEAVVDGSDVDDDDDDDVAEEVTAASARNTAANNHKGLARKVLPDVLGLFNSRLWNLWGSNV